MIEGDDGSHVVSALIRKRAEIAGKIEHLQAELREMVVALDNVESTLQLFAPDIDIGEIAPRRVPVAHHAFRGEMSRIILETLRRTTLPLNTMQLTETVMRERSLDTSDRRLFRTMSQRVGASLRRWELKGVLRSMPGPGRRKLWEMGG